MTYQFRVLYRKEMRDMSRDRRMIFGSFFIFILLPVLTALPLIQIVSDVSSPRETLYLTIESPERAPDLVSYLEQRNIKNSHDPEKVAEITLRLDPKFVEKMARGEQAMVTVAGDQSNDAIRSKLYRLDVVLNYYSQQQGRLRLIARGIDPTVISPLDIQKESNATPRSKGGFVLRSMVMVLLLTLFASSASVVTDLTVGERERKSLTLLLTHPMTTAEILLAKVTTIATFSLSCLFISLVSFAVVYSLVPWEELGFTIDLGPTFVLFGLFLGVPLVAMSASMLSFVALLTKSIKEAQMYTSFLIGIPFVPTLLDTFDIAKWLLPWLPVTGHQYAIMEFAKGNGIGLPELLVSSLATLAIAALMFWAGCRVLRSEKILFGT